MMYWTGIVSSKQYLWNLL